ncbi:hypothetical protein JAAARDRAFT_31958 [Jaapia argillacea MUCL 33604]|uniref:Endonuclease/exonuclease/phosphatase domain-containing protein n=1 Tax=Jaapia argillacea MUCL 33604 TaxID=933084 RepID=A0A067QEF2_9AGAM|nr:hypothetical protein JAAARDRAFT_31958 [Jaapia argillacea MUCL 33604]
MPPKRSSKRKATTSDEDVASEQASSLAKTKRAKVDQESGEAPPANAQPTNKVLPEDIVFPAKSPGTVRIVTWNVCGLAVAEKKGFKRYVEAEDPDILILTETKVNNEPVDPSLIKRFPYRYWSISEKKTYSGTAVLSKYKPLNVTKTLPGHPDPNSVKGRIITLEFDQFYVIGTYVVNAGQNLKTLDAKKEWNTHFESHIRDLDNQKPVIWTGDLNVAPTALVLTNAKRNWNKSAGYTEAETTSFANILDPPESIPGAKPFVDMWRKLHPTDQHYTYFSYRFNARTKGLGWRLDHFVLSGRIVDKVKLCEIRSGIYGASDHCPVVLEIEADLEEATS